MRGGRFGEGGQRRRSADDAVLHLLQHQRGVGGIHALGEGELAGLAHRHCPSASMSAASVRSLEPSLTTMTSKSG